MKNYLLIFILFFVITTNSYSTEISKVDQFILVDGGTFQMGDESSKKHSVTLDSFYISKYELTQKEWSDIMGYNPSVFKGDKNPVGMQMDTDFQLKLNGNLLLEAGIKQKTINSAVVILLIMSGGILKILTR